MKIAREGYPFIATAVAIDGLLVATGLILGGWWWLGPALWLPILAWVPAFFRDPVRSGERGDNLIIAPADGVVVLTDEVHESEYVGGDTRRVAIFMNVFNVHVNRYPVSGKVEHRNYHEGRFFNASLDKASDQNERMSLGIAASRGRVLVRQIAGLVARRIVTDAHPGDSALQGERLGLIRFGSRVDTFVPKDVEITVRVGTRTKAGVTVIGAWK